MNPTLRFQGSSAFRAHGSIHTRIEGRLIVSEVTGPWNRELVDDWALHTYHDALTLSETGPWVALGIFLESMMCTPDALDSIRRTVQYSAVKLRCVGYAIVADPSVEGRELLAPTFAAIYAGVVPYQMFSNVADARTWSQLQLRLNGADT